MSASLPRPSGGESLTSYPRSSGLAEGSTVGTHTTPLVTPRPLADHVPNTRQGGPKGGSRSGSTLSATTTTAMTGAVVSPRTRPAAVGAGRQATALSPRTDPHTHPFSLTAPLSETSGRTRSSTATSDVADSPRGTTATRRTVFTRRAGGSGRTAPSWGTQSSRTTTSTAESPSPAPTSPRPHTRRPLISAAEAARGALLCSPRGGPVSGRRGPALPEAPPTSRGVDPTEGHGSDGGEKENVWPSSRAGERGGAAEGVTRRGESPPPPPPRPTRAKPVLSLDQGAAAPASPRRPEARTSLRGQPGHAHEAAAEFFRYQYYYYPDEIPTRGAQDGEDDDGPSSILPDSRARPSRAARGRDTASSSRAASCELMPRPLSPPVPPLPQPTGEAPYTPRGVAASPFMQRLAESTASARRGSGLRSGGYGTPPPSVFSLRRATTQRTSSRATILSGASVSTTGSPRVSQSAHPPPGLTPAAGEQARAVTPSRASEETVTLETAEESAAREELERHAVRRQVQLTRVEALLGRARAVDSGRAAEKARVREEGAELAQQWESLQARTADVRAAVREVASKQSANDELTVLRDMLEEREKRLAALEGKRDALAELLAQLEILHTEAQAQDEQRRQQRRERRRRAMGQQGNEQQEEEDACTARHSDPGPVTDEDEGPATSCDRDRQARDSMARVARRRAVGFTDCPLDIPHGTGEEADADDAMDHRSGGHGTRPMGDDDNAQEEEEEEPEAVSPDAPGYSSVAPRRGRRLLSVSPSISCARGPSVLSAGTAGTLQGFLAELWTEVDALAMVCIQRPSPPAASRVNRGGASAWVRNINTGNNGYFSYFGGATEAHLSAKPLSTILSRASRLARAAWRAESELQLRARELATAAEEAELRRRLQGPPDPPRGHDSPTRASADGAGDAKSADGDASGSSTATPHRQPTSHTLLASPKLSRSAGRRGEGCGRRVTPPRSARPTTTATPAPVLFLPSLTYATPSLPSVSGELDTEQQHLQESYERDVEWERARRRRVVRSLKEAYRTVVAPPLRARLRAAQERQAALARELVDLGVAEVCLQWQELNDSDESGRESPSDDESEDRDMGAFDRRSRSRSRSMQGHGHRRTAKPQKPTKYLRQVIVRALQATTSPLADGPRTTLNTTRRSSGRGQSSTLTASARGESAPHPMPLDPLVDVTVPMVSFTHHRLPTTGPTAAGPTARERREAGGGSPSDGLRRSGRTSARPRGAHPAAEAALVTMATSSPLKTITPMTPSPRRVTAAAAGGPTSARQIPVGSPLWTRPGRESIPRLPHETRARGGASGGGAHALHAAPAAGGAVNLLGVHPADSQEVLDSGAVRVSLLFFGKEGRRRRRLEAEKDREMREFWALREELARVDEENFLRQCRLRDAEEAYEARRAKHAASVREAMNKLSEAKRYCEDLRSERGEWEDLYRELRAVQRSLES